jgi:acyl carrier protein
MKIENSKVDQMFTVSENNNVDSGNTHNESLTAIEIQAWLISYLVELLEIDPKEVDVTISFDRYGLDSATAIGLSGDLEDWLGYDLAPTILYDYPTIKTLASHLAKEFKQSNPKKP